MGKTKSKLESISGVEKVVIEAENSDRRIFRLYKSPKVKKDKIAEEVSNTVGVYNLGWYTDEDSKVHPKPMYYRIEERF